MEKWICAICGIQVLRGPALLLIVNNLYTYTSKSYKVEFSIFYIYFDVRLLELGSKILIWHNCNANPNIRIS